MLDHIIHVLGSVQVLHPLARSKKPIPISYGLHICPMCIHMHMCTCSIQVLVATESQKKPLKIFLVYVHTHTLTERKNPWGILEYKMFTPVGIPFSKMPHVVFSPWKKSKKSLIFSGGRPEALKRNLSFKSATWHHF